MNYLLVVKTNCKGKKIEMDIDKLFDLLNEMVNDKKGYLTTVGTTNFLSNELLETLK